MAELNCKVDRCVYNENSYCSKGDILVGGKDALCREETSCESFCDQKRDSCKSSIEHPSLHINIDCEATKCMYNEQYKCVANHVDIQGCGACDCHETACSTFHEK